MANQEHVSLCRQGASVWNRWRRNYASVYPDLSMANLKGCNFQGMDLSHANLRQARLSRADLRNADLTEADLEKANLRRACLRNACLQWAKLRDANLSLADLRGTDLYNADLYNTNLHQVRVLAEDLMFAVHTDSQHRVHMFAPTFCGKNGTSGRVSPTRGSSLNASAKLSHHLKEMGRIARLLLVMPFHPAKGDSKKMYPMS